MAYLSTQVQEKILSGEIKKYGPKSILSADELRERLAEIRRDGYAISYEEYYPGSLGISTPIFLSGGRIFGSLSVSGPIERFEYKKDQVLHLLIEQARILSDRISIHESY
jgi:DNA-binding IclR family transcriptional regulator